MTKYLIEFLDRKTEEVEAGFMEVSEYGTIRFYNNTIVHPNGEIEHSQLVGVVKESEVKFIKKLDRVPLDLADKTTKGPLQRYIDLCFREELAGLEMVMKSQRGVK